jgi:hypothetical protein
MVPCIRKRPSILQAYVFASACSNALQWNGCRLRCNGWPLKRLPPYRHFPEVIMTTSHRHHHSISIKLCFIVGVILALNALSAFSTGNPCEVLIPTNFEKLSLEKKIKASEVIRECERKLVHKPKEFDTKGLRSLQNETRTFAYTNTPANRGAH